MTTFQGNPPPPHPLPLKPYLGLGLGDSDLGTWMGAWQPDAWTAALRATGSDSWAVRRSKAECDAICAAQPGWRVWAFDLGRRDGATNQPKAFIAAATEVFLAAYAKE